MAGRTDLVYLSRQERIIVAVDPQLFDILKMSGCQPLDPQLLSASGLK